VWTCAGKCADAYGLQCCRVRCCCYCCVVVVVVLVAVIIYYYFIYIIIIIFIIAVTVAVAVAVVVGRVVSARGVIVLNSYVCICVCGAAMDGW